MENYSNLSKVEKQDIFEEVNSVHLKLGGDEKKKLKRAFTHDWKINKNIGSFVLFMKLYESEDVYDQMSDSFNKFLDESPYQLEDINKMKPIPYIKHVRRITMMQNEMDKLYSDLDDVKEGKGYISQEHHEQILKEQLEKQQQIIREKTDSIAKLRNTEDALREKLLAQQKQFEEDKKQYEKTIDLISKNN